MTIHLDKINKTVGVHVWDFIGRRLMVVWCSMPSLVVCSGVPGHI